MGTELLSMCPADPNRSAANDRYTLWKLGITHVVNVAHGSPHSQGSRNFYEPSVDYYGVPAHDSPSFDLSSYFIPSADYIQKALDGYGGKSTSPDEMFCWEPLVQQSSFVPLSSPGVGPLCSRGESLGLAGASLPDGSPWLPSSAGHQQGQGAQVDLSK